MSSIKGDCACGKIQVEIPKPLGSGLCHCTDCRKTGGGPNSINLMFPRDQVKLSGEAPKMFQKPGGSGSDVQRYFCGDCGSQIYSNADSASDFSFIRAGLFAPGDIPSPTIHLYAKNFEPWEKTIQGAHAFPEMPPSNPAAA